MLWFDPVYCNLILIDLTWSADKDRPHLRCPDSSHLVRIDFWPLLYRSVTSQYALIQSRLNQSIIHIWTFSSYSRNDCNNRDVCIFACPSVMAVVRFYSDEVVDWRALQRAARLYPQLSITTELCYNVELTGEHKEAPKVWMRQKCRASIRRLKITTFRLFCHVVLVSMWLSPAGCSSLSAGQKEVLLWLFRPPLQVEPLSETPKIIEGSGEKLVEIGPRYCYTHAVWKVWIPCLSHSQ